MEIRVVGEAGVSFGWQIVLLLLALLKGLNGVKIKELCKLAADNTARRSNICEMHEPWKVTRGHMHNLSEYQV